MVQAKQDCTARERTVLNKMKMYSCHAAALHIKFNLCVIVCVCETQTRVVSSPHDSPNLYSTLNNQDTKSKAEPIIVASNASLENHKKFFSDSLKRLL